MLEEEDEEDEDDQSHQIRKNGDPPRVCVKLIILRDGDSETFSSKAVTQLDKSDDLIAGTQSSRLAAYHNSSSPEMNERETLKWMVRGGYHSAALLNVKDPRHIFWSNDIFSPIIVKRDYSSIDYSFQPAYSKLNNEVSKLPKDENGVQDF
ncbi:hypothetical protein K505DRAFT_383797 [Melanomma pulvis-pyrius CBS 109.77]|uniref:Uncharacterized protein n=1 Tax=Melanomma pulvis-pyrius CBS 109.77 TaxID=1314802 RepID=A0A6A6XU93_9PLEO|nr:hypothetical protein K505DRAFT_383797 [Melanomma pulvis-pyrius CBS 109.77]